MANGCTIRPSVQAFHRGGTFPPPSLRHVVIMSYYTLHPRGSLRCVVSVRAHPEISLGFAGRTSFSGATARIDTPRPRPGRPYSRASRRWASWAQSDRWSGRPPGAPPSSLASSFTGGASPRRPAGAVAPRVLAASLRWRLGALCVPLARGSVVPCSPSLAAARLRARGPGYARPEHRTPNRPSPEPPARFRTTAKSACARIFRPSFSTAVGIGPWTLVIGPYAPASR